MCLDTGLQVPVKLRVGPWSPLASAYLVVVTCTLAYGGIWWSGQQEQAHKNVAVIQSPMTPSNMHSSYWWYYNVCGFVWMMYISYLVLVGPAGWNAWATYSMWSWSVVMIRHGLASLEPWMGDSLLLAKLLQYTLLPSLNMATITTCMWNFIVGPAVYFFFLKTRQQREKFLSYFTSFRLTQIHVFVLAYAVVNGMSTPSPEFTFGDLYMAVLVTFWYMLLYLLVLDRIGVHLYPIFSPRTHWCVVIWSGMWCFHVLVYWLWKEILLRYIKSENSL